MTTNVERAVLGYKIIIPSLHSELLSEDLFVNATNRKIFQAIREFEKKGVPITEPALADALKGKVSISHILSCNEGFSMDMKSIPKWFDRDVKNLYRNKILRDIGEWATNNKDNPLADFEEVREMLLNVDKEDIKKSFSAREVLSQYEAEIDDDSTLIWTGLPGIDKEMRGLRKGEVLLTMARTTVGKTWILLNILSYIAPKLDGKIVFFSMEMSAISIMERLIQLNFGISQDEAKKLAKDPKTTAEIEKKFENLVFYDGIYSVSEIETRGLMNKAGLIMIDYIQIIKDSTKGSSYERASEVITKIKQLAKTTNSVVIVVSQLSRAAGDGSIPVTLQMARESGALEEQSDFVLGAWRPELNEDNNTSGYKDRIFIKLLKNKRGYIKLAECHFDKPTGKITEIREEDQELGLAEQKGVH